MAPAVNTAKIGCINKPTRMAIKAMGTSIRARAGPEVMNCLNDTRSPSNWWMFTSRFLVWLR